MEVDVDKNEVLKRGYAQTIEEWWFLVDDMWNPLFSIIGRFNPKDQAKAEKARKKRKATDLYVILNRAWAAAPDSGSIHSIKGWGRLCDLCSDFPGEEEKSENI